MMKLIGHYKVKSFFANYLLDFEDIIRHNCNVQKRYNGKWQHKSGA